MRTLSRLLPLTVLAVAAAVAPAAQAAVPHVVQPGETLWSISAANNFTTRSLAAANGLPETANVVLGTTIKIPTVAEAALALRGAAPAAPGAPAAAAPAGAPAPLGSYVVRPGDSLSALAANSGVPLSQMAYMNGLDPAEPLLIGTVLKLPTGAPAPPGAAQPAPAARVVPAAAPAATAARVNAAQIAQLAAAQGVPPSLASAIAWQESGFNNAMVSSANARGVMQIMPGTWDFVQRNLAREPLDPNSALDNVHAGVIFLGHLLQEAGGDPATAAAGYYQGLGSVRRIGMLPETRRYVANVLALRSRFGGP